MHKIRKEGTGDECHGAFPPSSGVGSDIKKSRRLMSAGRVGLLTVGDLWEWGHDR